MNNVGNNEFVNDSCATGPDIIIGDQMGMVDVVSALNSDLVVWLSCSSNIHLCNNQKLLLIPTLIIKTRNKEEMTVSAMQLDKQEKTLTLAVKLQQRLALAKLLDIMNSEQKTVRDWPVCQQAHTYKSNLH
jgi:hypothetical protein